MRRHRHIPALESLEGKALLSPVADGAPAETDPRLKVTLTPSKRVYSPGQTIEFNITETNTSRHEVTALLGPVGVDVTRNGTTVWTSTVGPAGQAVDPITLAPGQSVTFSGMWDGQSNVGPESTPTGVLILHIAMPGAPAAAVRVTNTPPVVAPGSPGLDTTLTTNQTVYQQGQPVVMTVTETNTSKHDETVVLAPGSDGFEITANGTEVWASSTGTIDQDAHAVVLGPGQSTSFSATWDGESNVGSASTPTGTLVIQSQYAGAPTAAIQVVAAAPVTAPVPSSLSVTLTTNQSVYQEGQPVVMTVTATNNTSRDETVDIMPASVAFQVFQNDTEVWTSQPSGVVSLDIEAVTIAPGETVTLSSATWDGQSNVGPASTPTGTLVVRSLFDAVLTVTIQIENS